MGLWVPASSEIDNRETWPLTNFWILLLTLLEFFHKALTNASLSHYPITAQALVSDLADPDYSLVRFSGCGAFLWITVPTFCHQLAPEGWRLLAALPVNWAVTFTHPVKEFLQRCYWSVSKIPYYRKLTLHEIKVLEINANLMANDFRIKKEEVEFHNKGN